MRPAWTWLALIVGVLVGYWLLRDIPMTWGGFLLYLVISIVAAAAWRIYKERRQG